MNSKHATLIFLSLLYTTTSNGNEKNIFEIRDESKTPVIGNKVIKTETGKLTSLYIIGEVIQTRRATFLTSKNTTLIITIPKPQWDKAKSLIQKQTTITYMHSTGININTDKPHELIEIK